MKTVKVYQYRVRDPATGRKYTTRYKLTEEEAEKRYPERERADWSEEARTVYDKGEAPISSHQIVFGPRQKVMKASRRIPESWGEAKEVDLPQIE